MIRRHRHRGPRYQRRGIRLYRPVGMPTRSRAPRRSDPARAVPDRGRAPLPFALVALMALALASPARAAAHAPGTSWEKVAPAAVGLDAAKLAQIAVQARRGHSNCLVVVRDGKLAGEWYFNGTGPDTTQDVYSATKSFASTLVGIAQDDGDLRIGDRASRWIPRWRGTRGEGRDGARPPEHGLGTGVGRRHRLPATARARPTAPRSRSASGKRPRRARSGRTTTRRCRRSTACSPWRPAVTSQRSPARASSRRSAWRTPR